MAPANIEAGKSYTTKTFGMVRVVQKDTSYKSKGFFKCFSKEYGLRILHASVFVKPVEPRVAA